MQEMNEENPLAPRARAIRTMFSSIAGSYDFLNHFLSLSIDKLWRRRVVRTTLALVRQDAPKPLRILDVCTGTGDLAFDFARHAPKDALIFGLDFSHAMLRLALKKRDGLEGDAPGCKGFAEGDALRLPFPDGVFDVATVAFGLRNYVDRQAGLKEMARVVRPGGQVVILEFSQLRIRWLQALYAFYLHRVLPWIGNRLSRSQAYRYLADTVQAFPTPVEVQGWMKQAGLVDIKYKRLTGGIVVHYRGMVG